MPHELVETKTPAELQRSYERTHTVAGDLGTMVMIAFALNNGEVFSSLTAPVTANHAAAFDMTLRGTEAVTMADQAVLKQEK